MVLRVWHYDYGMLRARVNICKNAYNVTLMLMLMRSKGEGAKGTFSKVSKIFRVARGITPCSSSTWRLPSMVNVLPVPATEHRWSHARASCLCENLTHTISNAHQRVDLWCSGGQGCKTFIKKLNTPECRQTYRFGHKQRLSTCGTPRGWSANSPHQSNLSQITVIAHRMQFHYRTVWR